MNIYWIFGQVSAYSLLLPVVAGFFRYRGLAWELKIFCWLLFLMVPFDVVLTYTSYKGINNLAIMNVYTVLQCTFFVFVFREAITGLAIRTGIVVLLAGFGVFAVANLLWMQGWNQFNSWTMGLQCLLLTLIVLLYLYGVFREGKVMRLERYPMFWVASGVLIYFAGNLFLFIFINYVLTESDSLGRAEWGIHSVLNISANICYTAGLWLNQRN